MSVSIYINNQQTPPHTYNHTHTYAQTSMKAHIKIKYKKKLQDFSDRGIALLIPEGFRTNAIEIKMTNRN